MRFCGLAFVCSVWAQGVPAQTPWFFGVEGDFDLVADAALLSDCLGAPSPASDCLGHIAGTCPLSPPVCTLRETLAWQAVGDRLLADLPAAVPGGAPALQAQDIWRRAAADRCDQVAASGEDLPTRRAEHGHCLLQATADRVLEIRNQFPLTPD